MLNPLSSFSTISEIPFLFHSGVYEFDVMSRQPERGFYRLVVSTMTSDSRLVGHMAAQLTFKVLTAIDIQGVEVGTADSDRSTAPSLQKWVAKVVLGCIVRTASSYILFIPYHIIFQRNHYEMIILPQLNFLNVYKATSKVGVFQRIGIVNNLE